MPAGARIGRMSVLGFLDEPTGTPFPLDVPAGVTSKTATALRETLSRSPHDDCK